ncbi:ubiquitin-conjugating enzyme-like protein [Leishmania mexicana MHOM/GT/2001/U1103]|uniref:Ubiquitin-conjugating enzyme-like protein n=1 Tax=Leishmania mexicana (strain MHOM/GT/2001/U1103) TaxID=929439 RepID=E9AVP3_LEIMU|nr:ubiquitin-conjugating enzyme-like protein [Leishmania mexicana MHOM/GT/2001/U1103]CBZ27026.1 ubiquitin-conjugating enzyme-like protein [Leishmania mexicana MHOM/GT/2001/U1103]
MQAARLPTRIATGDAEEAPQPPPVHAPATPAATDGQLTDQPQQGVGEATVPTDQGGFQPPSAEALAARQSRNSAGAEKMGGGQRLRDHTTAQRRLMQDYRTFQKNMAEGTSSNITALPVDGDFFHWHAVISGPCDTPWEGGLFKLDLVFGDDYPFSPPKVRFRTKDVFHPNVYVDGNICMDTLKSSWQSSLNLEALLISIQSLLSDPNPLSAANGAAARLLTENRSAYEEKIRALVEESLEQSFSMDDDSDDAELDEEDV